MTIKQLARVFLRFQGLLFLGTAIYECTSISRDYRTFVTNAMSSESQAYGIQIFWMGVLRTAVYALFALVLLIKTDHVISFLAGKTEPQE